MQGGPAWWLTAAIVLAAGCTTSSADDSTGPGPSVITRPDDYSYLDNGTRDDGAHIHDYWGAQERIAIMDERVSQVGPGIAGGQSTEVHTFKPESGHVVPQGTSSVEVTIAWTDAPGDMYSNPELWVKTAADHAAWPAGSIASGDTTAIESTNERNDLPHQLLSAWAFEFRLSSPDPPEPFIRFKGDISIRVEVVRGLEIPLFPGHVDRWKGAAELSLLSTSADLAYAHDPVDGGCDGIACQQIHTPDNGSVVPHNATTVVAVLTQDDPTGLMRIGLAYHSAEGRDFTRLPADDESGAARTYRIPVAGYGDGPYAIQSQWEFMPIIEAPVEDGVTVTSYTLDIVVLKDA